MDLINKYTQLLISLLPRGRLFAYVVEGTIWWNLLGGIAKELERIHLRALNIINEADPRSTVEMLTEWEEVLGIQPAVLDTFGQRRDRVVAKYIYVGGQTKQFMIDLALRFGYVITIRTFKPFQVGRSKIGDGLYSNWQYTWEVVAPLSAIATFQVGRNRVGEPLGAVSSSILQDEINRAKPAHTAVFFTYV